MLKLAGQFFEAEYFANQCARIIFLSTLNIKIHDTIQIGETIYNTGIDDNDVIHIYDEAKYLLPVIGDRKLREMLIGYPKHEIEASIRYYADHTSCEHIDETLFYTFTTTDVRAFIEDEIQTYYNNRFIITLSSNHVLHFRQALPGNEYKIYIPLTHNYEFISQLNLPNEYITKTTEYYSKYIIPTPEYKVVRGVLFKTYTLSNPSQALRLIKSAHSLSIYNSKFLTDYVLYASDNNVLIFMSDNCWYVILDIEGFISISNIRDLIMLNGTLHSMGSDSIIQSIEYERGHDNNRYTHITYNTRKNQQRPQTCSWGRLMQWATHSI